jgi:hypothetical protein
VPATVAAVRTARARTHAALAVFYAAYARAQLTAHAFPHNGAGGIDVDDDGAAVNSATVGSYYSAGALTRLQRPPPTQRRGPRLSLRDIRWPGARIEPAAVAAATAAVLESTGHQALQPIHVPAPPPSPPLVPLPPPALRRFHVNDAHARHASMAFYAGSGVPPQPLQSPPAVTEPATPPAASAARRRRASAGSDGGFIPDGHTAAASAAVGDRAVALGFRAEEVVSIHAFVFGLLRCVHVILLAADVTCPPPPAAASGATPWVPGPLGPADGTAPTPSPVASPSLAPGAGADVEAPLPAVSPAADVTLPTPMPAAVSAEAEPAAVQPHQPVTPATVAAAAPTASPLAAAAASVSHSAARHPLVAAAATAARVAARTAGCSRRNARYRCQRAARVSVAVVAAAIIPAALAGTLQSVFTHWAALTVAYLAGGTEGGAFRTSLLRLTGTLAGSSFGFTIVRLVDSNPVAVGVLAAVWVGAMNYPRAHPATAYVATVAAFSGAIVMLGSGVGAALTTALALQRIEETIIGVAVFVAASNAVFPLTARHLVRSRAVEGLECLRVALGLALDGYGDLLAAAAAAAAVVPAAAPQSGASMPPPPPLDPSPLLGRVDALLTGLPELLLEADAEPSLWRGPPAAVLHSRYEELGGALARGARAARVLRQCVLALQAGGGGGGGPAAAAAGAADAPAGSGASSSGRGGGGDPLYGSALPLPPLPLPPTAAGPATAADSGGGIAGSSSLAAFARLARPLGELAAGLGAVLQLAAEALRLQQQGERVTGGSSRRSSSGGGGARRLRAWARRLCAAEVAVDPGADAAFAAARANRAQRAAAAASGGGGSDAADAATRSLLRSVSVRRGPLAAAAAALPLAVDGLHRRLDAYVREYEACLAAAAATTGTSAAAVLPDASSVLPPSLQLGGGGLALHTATYGLCEAVAAGSDVARLARRIVHAEARGSALTAL